MGRAAQRKRVMERKEKNRRTRSVPAPVQSTSLTSASPATPMAPAGSSTQRKTSRVKARPLARTTRSQAHAASLGSNGPQATLDAISEASIDVELTHLPQSTPHPNKDSDINPHLFHQLSMSLIADPDVFDDGEVSEFKLPVRFPNKNYLDGSALPAEEEDNDSNENLSLHYEDNYDDDTLPPEPPATKPKGHGHPKTLNLHFEDSYDDDTLPPKQAEAAALPATKPRGRGHPRKGQSTSEMEGTVVPKRKGTKRAVSKSDADSSDNAEPGEYLYLSAGMALRFLTKLRVSFSSWI